MVSAASLALTPGTGHQCCANAAEQVLSVLSAVIIVNRWISAGELGGETGVLFDLFLHWHCVKDFVQVIVVVAASEYEKHEEKTGGTWTTMNPKWLTLPPTVLIMDLTLQALEPKALPAGNSVPPWKTGPSKWSAQSYWTSTKVESDELGVLEPALSLGGIPVCPKATTRQWQILIWQELEANYDNTRHMYRYLTAL